MFIKTSLIFLALFATVFSQTDDEEPFLFVTKQTVNRFIVQDRELTVKYGLYNSGPSSVEVKLKWLYFEFVFLTL